jgi:glutamyl-tRNA reductase
LENRQTCQENAILGQTLLIVAMEKTVLILGGTGRIGQSVALDIINHTAAKIIITGRKEKAIKLLPRMQFLALDLEEIDKLRQAIKNSDLVIASKKKSIILMLVIIVLFIKS